MANHLEQIIRPAQDGSIRPMPAIGYQAPPVVPGSNIVTWGHSGANVFQLTAHLRQNIQPIKSNETQRTFDVLKIKNPDDPSQYVMVEAMTEYQARNVIDNGRITMKYATQSGSANVEVVSKGNVRTSSGG